MFTLLYIAGSLQIVIGIVIVIAARSAMHETTAAVLIGMGFLSLGLGRLIQLGEEGNRAPSTVAKGQTGANPAGDLLLTYKNYDIRRVGMFVKAGGQMFNDVDAAKTYIDKLQALPPAE